MNKIYIISFLLITSLSFAATKDQVKELVTNTCKEIMEGTPSTVFEKIKKGEHPYKNANEPSLYVFVYNEDVCSVAHFKPAIVGKCYKGKPDVRGKKFRDEIVQGALTKKEGWVTYHYQKPGASGIHEKEAFYKLCPNKGKNYIVASGKYK